MRSGFLAIRCLLGYNGEQAAGHSDILVEGSRGTLDRPIAGFQEIRKGFRELAKKRHPDRRGDSPQSIELVEIHERPKG